MKTILIVDDDPVVRRLLVLYVSAAGYRALEAATGAEAIRLMKFFAEDIDLAIVDQMLEDRKGSEVAAALTAIRADTRTLLISGALESDVTSELALDQPIASFLQKPFSRQVMLEKIRQVLANRSAAGADAL
jgi:two-component system OmpR family response regulator